MIVKVVAELTAEFTQPIEVTHSLPQGLLEFQVPHSRPLDFGKFRQGSQFLVHDSQIVHRFRRHVIRFLVHQASRVGLQCQYLAFAYAP